MNKLFASIIFAILFTACGETKKTEEQETDSIPSDTSLALLDTMAVDTVAEDLPERNETKYWENKLGDIPQGYVDRVDKLVRTSTATQVGDEMDFNVDYLNEKGINELNTYELIYYCLTYPCSFSQNCAMDEYQDSTSTPKILSYFPDSYGEASKSTLQNDALDTKRDSIILVLNKYILKHPGKTDAFYTILLRDLNAIESIPAVAKTGSANCTANFTLLINLMSRANYEPFKATDIYQTMFGENSYTYGARVEANAGNMKTIRDLATKMYMEKKGK